MSWTGRLQSYKEMYVLTDRRSDLWGRSKRIDYFVLVDDQSVSHEFDYGPELLV